MGKGGYLGGSTVIGAGSSWFSYGNSPKHRETEEQRAARAAKTAARAAQRAAEATRRRELKRLKAEAEAEEHRKKRAAKKARRAAEWEKNRGKRLADMERRQVAKTRNLDNIEVVVRRKGREIPAGTVAFRIPVPPDAGDSDSGFEPR